MPTLPAAVIEAHRFAGYALVFGLVPLALIFQPRRGLHRALGLIYVAMMTLQYFSGLVMTLRHVDDPWLLWRNLAFNFLGYHFVLLAWRAIWRHRHDAPAGRLDAAMRWLLIAPGALLAVLGAGGHFPSFVLGLLALWLGWLDSREHWQGKTAGGGPPPQLRRHLRYMWASYFYVLTVLSLVELRGVLPSDMRWLWPALLGTPLLAWVLSDGPAWALRQRQAARLVTCIALTLGAYVAGSRVFAA